MDNIQKRKDAGCKYLCCIWCGRDIAIEMPEAMYCSRKCRQEAIGHSKTPNADQHTMSGTAFPEDYGVSEFGVIIKDWSERIMRADTESDAENMLKTVVAFVLSKKNT